MGGTAAGVLRKKLSSIQTRGYNFPVQAKLAAKLEYAAAKGATTALGCTVEAIVEQSRVDRLSPLIDTLPMPGLFVLLHSEAGDTGLIGFDMRLVDHVVDILAGGDPNSSAALPARTPTAIDAAFCQRVTDAILAQFDAGIRAIAGEASLSPLHNGRIEHMPTNLQYMLPDQQYLSCHVNLDIGDDARTGDFHLALPLSWIEPVEAALQRSGFTPGQSESESWGRHMRKVVRLAPLSLTAVVDRYRLQVAELTRLEVGGVLPLGETGLSDVALMLETSGGKRTIGRGKLGIYKRNKAIRISEISDPSFFAPLAEALNPESHHG